MDLLELCCIIFICQSHVQSETDCMGMQCSNGGTLHSNTTHCQCVCEQGLSGIYCEIDHELSFWPGGPYAIPMSTDGCPELKTSGWLTGYINITTKDPVNILVSQRTINHDNQTISEVYKDTIIDYNPNVNTMGSYGDHTLQLNYCYKTSQHLFNMFNDWPEGDYAVYGEAQGCPNGFTGEMLSLPLPDVLQYNIDGYLPQFSIETNDTGQDHLNVLVCVKNEPDYESDFTSNLGNWKAPFIFVKVPGINCTYFRGFHIVEEAMYVLPGNETNIEDKTPLFEFCFYTPEKWIYNRITWEEYDLTPRPYQYDIYIVKYMDLAMSDVFLQNVQFTSDRIITTGYNSHNNSSFITFKKLFLNLDFLPWIVFDIGRRASIWTVNVEINFRKHEIDVSDLRSHIGYPVFYISDQKWSFLTNGAIRCRYNARYLADTWENLNVLLEYEFLRPMEGIYLSMVGNKKSTPDQLLFFLNLIRDFRLSTYTKTACNRDLGMTDAVIEDYQISASSWQLNMLPYMARLYHSGWCADPGDTEPYLQIDVIAPTVIDGIRLVNWNTVEHYMVDNIFTKQFIIKGTRSFRIQYGVHLDTLHEYSEKEFTIDLSKPYEEIQTFLFLKPFLARYIKVFPTPLFNTTCLEIELLGCRKAVRTSLECVNESSSEIVNVTTAYISVYEPLVVNNISTWQTCANMCFRDLEKCSTIVYISNDTCSLHRPSKNDNLIIWENKEDNKVVSMVICSKDVTDVQPPLFNFTNELRDESTYHDVTAEGVLTSFRYPFTYLTGRSEVWHIHFNEGEYIRLVFTNISLHNYQLDETDTSFLDRYWNEDVISIRENEYDNPDYTLKSELNGLQPIIATSVNDLYITFISGIKKSKYFKKSGLRVIVQKDDVPSCFSFTSLTTIECTLPSAYLASYAYYGFGLLDNGLLYISITNDDYDSIRPIVLRFLEFDIRCSNSGHFHIKDYSIAGNVLTYYYCNDNKPVSVIQSSFKTLTIEYLPETYTTEFQGFKAHYRIKQLDEVLLNLTTYKKDSESESLTLCSAVLNKCYYIASTNWDKPYWNKADLMCQRQNMDLVVLQSRLEMNYLRLALEKFATEQNTFNRSQGFDDPSVNFYSHIGLKYITADDGITRPIWADGSPLLFSAWDSAQPADVNKRRCARMNFFEVNKEDTWVTQTCETNSLVSPRGYYICQSMIENTITLSTKNLLSGVHIPSSYHLHDNGLLHLCNSGEYITILSLCDGLQNCQDGSDENGCQTSIAGPMLLESDTLMFQCLDGGLIHLSDTCNFIQDCGDNSDEDCVFPECSSYETRCDNFQCIPDIARCDGIINCLDGSDEQLCDWCVDIYNDVMLCHEDRICIPSSKLCDKQNDCSDGEDESNCNNDLLYYSTCLEWWKQGYRTNGFYKIDYQNGTFECIFEYIDATRMSVTTVDYSTDIDRDGKLVQKHSNDTKSSHLCSLQVNQTCTPDMLAVASYDGIFYGRMYSECACVSLTMNNLYRNNYSYCKNASLTPPWDPQDVSIMRQYHVWLEHDPTNSMLDMKYMRLTPSPLTCSIEMNTETYEKKFLCSKDNKVIPDNKRCLYDVDGYGNIDGCLSLEHLHNCEHFKCPLNYVKCPNSFCLATQFVCDGIKQCVDGEDERNCWCQESNDEVAIVYFETLNDDIVQNILVLSRHVSSKHNVVRVIRVAELQHLVLRPSDALKQYRITENVIGKSRDLYISEISILTKSMEELYLYFNFFFKNESSNRAFIYIQEDRRLEAMKNSQSLVHQYFVSLDNSGNKERIDVKRSNQDTITEIKISSWNFLDIAGHVLFPDVCKEFYEFSCFNGYMCSNSRVCISLDKVCDGQIHCPHGDDEHLCNFICPDKCTCRGFNVFCRHSNFTNADFSVISRNSRSFDISNNRHFEEYPIDVHQLANLPFLIKFNISKCFFQNLSSKTFSKTLNIRVLDLSYNKLKHIEKDTFIMLRFLHTLILKGSHYLTRVMPGAFNGLLLIRELSLTNTLVHHISPETFQGLNLTHLDISRNRINQVSDFAFNGLTVKNLDLNHNNIKTFGKNIFTGMMGTQIIRSPAYKFCCVRPSYVQEDNCFPLKDEFSSCSDLMRNSALQTIMWVIGLCALLGNVASLIYRLRFDRKRLKLGYGIFVINLAIADLMMGIYLLIIAVADMVFRNRYIVNDEYWRTSVWCSMAGVLSTMSSEASVLFMCLITIDRLLVIKYPFGQIRIKQRSAIVSSLAVWIIVFGIAMLPIIHVNYFQNKFYTKSAVCIALPLTRDRPSGWLYSVVIFIGFNFLTFVLIAIGQWMIYREVQNSSGKIIVRKSGSRRNDLKVARNLLLVVTTDFLCWFPIGCMGIMAIYGHVISGDVYAWTAVFILPINSAMNPFLYTLSAILHQEKFSPSVDEQSTNEGQIAIRKNILKVWSSRYFERKVDTSASERSKSLDDTVLVRKLLVCEIIKISLQLSSCLKFLHNNSMVHGMLSLKTITVVHSLDGENVDHVMILLPQQTKKTYGNVDKSKDIYDLGCILRQLMINCDI